MKCRNSTFLPCYCIVLFRIARLNVLQFQSLRIRRLTFPLCIEFVDFWLCSLFNRETFGRPLVQAIWIGYRKRDSAYRRLEAV